MKYRNTRKYEKRGEMKREILVEDGVGGEHKVKYLDESRVIVQKVTRIQPPEGSEESDYVRYSMPGKVKLHEIDSWPFTEELKIQITDFHAQFTAAE